MEKKGGKRLAPTGGAQKPPVTTVPPSAPEGAAPEGAAAPAEKPVSRGRKLWNDYGYLLITLAVVFVLFKVILQLAYVPTGSMETTIPTKTLLIGWRLPYAVADPMPERGDIVTFYSDELSKVLVKRVVGLPGEKITFKNGYTYINGEKLDESYLPEQGITDGERVFEVPEGHIFLMGDNRPGSRDCRSFEQPYIAVDKIQGRMLVAISVGREQSWQGVRWIG